MKKVTREQWCQALESGEYKQARNMLYDNTTEGFCCLGVAGDLAGIDRNLLGQRGIMGYLNPDFPELAKMLDLSEGEERALADANDKGRRFKTIARMIRTGSAK